MSKARCDIALGFPLNCTFACSTTLSAHHFYHPLILSRLVTLIQAGASPLLQDSEGKGSGDVCRLDKGLLTQLNPTSITQELVYFIDAT